MNKNIKLFFSALFISTSVFAVGQSAVPTLIFPPGGRGTTMSETFVGLADDVTAVYHNPAGLALAPLANTWQSYAEVTNYGFKYIKAKKKMSFAEKPVIWASTLRDLYRFNGMSWINYETYLMDQNDNLEKVLKRFTGDEDISQAVIDTVRKFNDFSADVKDEDIIDVKLPFSIVLKSNINCLEIDEQNRVWIGTKAGLKRYDGLSFKTYTTIDGLIGNEIRSISLLGTEVNIGTDKGVGVLADADWKNYNAEKNGLPSNDITYVKKVGTVLWVGTKNSGLVSIEQDSVKIFTKKDGLLSDQINGIATDNENNVITAHPEGVTQFNGKKWKIFRVKDNIVMSVEADDKGQIWIGTPKGLLRYYKGKPTVDKYGKITYKDQEWKHFHSKNALTGDTVVSISSSGKDVWIVTDKTINCFKKADRQIVFAHEQLLPAFNFPDLYHDFVGLSWPTEEWGTIGAFINFISFGEIVTTDPLGRETGNFYSWEIVGSLCYGTQIRKNLGFGINAKVVYSPLAPSANTNNQKEEGIGKTIAIDAAILKRELLPSFDLGVHLQNMGPPIFYIDKDQADPIPLTLKIGTAYHLLNDPVHRINLAFDANRELVKPNEVGVPDAWYRALFTSLNDESWRREIEQIILNAGAEYIYSDFISFGTGMLYDPDGSRRELTFGVGVQYGNLRIDWSYIFQIPWLSESSPARDGQQRFSLLFKF